MKKFDVYYRPRHNNGDGQLLYWSRTANAIAYDKAINIMSVMRRQGYIAYIMIAEDGAPVPISQAA